MACDFPGRKSGDVWELLRAGGDAIEEYHRTGGTPTQLYAPEPGAAGKMNTRWGGFVKGIDRFDANFFGISPREAVKSIRSSG